MKIIYYVLETQNPYGRDQNSEARARNLAMALMNSKELSYEKEIKPLDYYSSTFKETLDAESKNVGVFQVIIPGGQNAQERLWLTLSDVNTENTFIIYNSMWDIMSNHERQFGNINKELHYNLYNSLSNTDKKIHEQVKDIKFIQESWHNTYELGRCMMSLCRDAQLGLFKKSSLPTDPLDEPNSSERLSKHEPAEIWQDAERFLPQKIAKAIVVYQDVLKDEETEIKRLGY